VYLRADRQTVYDPIAQVVSTLGQAGLDVRLVTQPDDAGGSK
jgi:biopolymer transport protein ExbD